MTNETRKIELKRLLLKAMEDGIKKGVEIALIALVVGASLKLVFTAIPGVMLGAIFAKLVKIWGFNY